MGRRDFGSGKMDWIGLGNLKRIGEDTDTDLEIRYDILLPLCPSSFLSFFGLSYYSLDVRVYDLVDL